MEIAGTHRQARSGSVRAGVLTGRIAVVCSGLGLVNRGFERYTRELFDAVAGEADVTLFKGGGQRSTRERVLRVPNRRTWPLRRLEPDRAVSAELVCFALRLLPHLARGRFELVHYIEPYLGNLLHAARRRLGLRFSLLLTDGLGLTAASSRRADLLHVVTPLAREALAGTRLDERLFFVPHGVHTADFAGGGPQAEARARLGLPAGGRILLDVAAVNRRHKRSDVLIEEVARVAGEPALVLAGHPEERDLLELGRARLGDRFFHLRLRPEQMPLVYAAADVFIHAAVEEGFCLAAVEAMAAGLPVVVHDSPHFAWLVGDEGQLADMTRPGALAGALAGLPAEAGERNRARAADFDWAAVGPGYVDMYERALGYFPRASAVGGPRRVRRGK